MVGPSQTLTGLEGLSQLRLVGEDGGHSIKPSGHVDGADFVGKIWQPARGEVRISRIRC